MGAQGMARAGAELAYSAFREISRTPRAAARLEGEFGRARPVLTSHLQSL
jgi:hypothetical protein